MFILSLILFVLISVPTYSGIGFNNVIVTVGGGYTTGYVGSSLISSTNGYYVDTPGFSFGGGSFKTEIGYILSGVTSKRSIVNSLDIRANFSMSWRDTIAYKDPFGHISQKSQTLGGGFAAVYSVGSAIDGDRDEKSSRIMFDIIGVGMFFNHIPITRTIVYLDSVNQSKSKTLYQNIRSIDFILPGIYYVHSSGFNIGIRSKIMVSINTSSKDNYFPHFNIESNAYFGFMYGK